MEVRLDIDANRDGSIESDEPGRWDWVWDEQGTGAIVAPDLDVENAGDVNSELAEMRLVVTGEPPAGLELALSIDRSAAGAITIYRQGSSGNLEPIVGAGAGANGATTAISGLLDPEGEPLWLQARAFPDVSFRGLVEIFVLAGGQIFDSVLFRVSPWIMTPNTLPAECVYVVKLASGSNLEFLRGLEAACDEAAVKLEVFASEVTGGDHWIQDEIEFGYSQTPKGAFPVVCDGPRGQENEGLDALAESRLRGPGLGLIEIGSHLGDRTSLDSFGNLEVSPPVVVDGYEYPLGRIVIGNRRSGPSNPNRDRRPALRLREFLYAQQVQSPFEIHSDWLSVGHVDEVISFVPAPNRIGFQILIASPRTCEELFRRLHADGFDQATCWSGQVRIDHVTRETSPADETVDDLLNKSNLWAFNRECQTILDDIHGELERELGLSGNDIVEIPVAFKRMKDGRALAYFPDMVNHLVLGDISIVPKPYGPRLADRPDPIEQAFIDAVPQQKVRFIDDWIPYHEMSGEVHCGTNVRRRPAEDVRWWEHRYPGVHDASVRRARG